MLNVQIVQPLIPEYRVPFFQALLENTQHRVRIFASRTLPNAQDIKTASLSSPYVYLEHPSIGLFNNKLLWQKGMLLERSLTAGDVLVLCGNARLLSNYPLIWQARKRHVATVWWGIGAMPGQNRLNYYIRRRLMRWTDVVLLYTEKEKKEFMRMGFPPDRLFAINNAIDQTPIREATQKWSATRLRSFQEEHGIHDKQLFLFCGRLAVKARVDLAIEALALLKEANKHCLLILIGDGEERDRLRDLAEKLGVMDSIRWLGALYEQEVMAPWFLSAKVFVYPGYIGLSIMHAMGYGLPVITHDNMDNQSPEVAALRNGENGILFKENSSKDLARRMMELISNESLRMPMSAQALVTAQEEFTLPQMVKRFWDATCAAASLRSESCLDTGQ